MLGSFYGQLVLALPVSWCLLMLPTFFLEDGQKSAPANWESQGILSPVAFSPRVPARREWLKSLDIWRKLCGPGWVSYLGPGEMATEFISRVDVCFSHQAELQDQQLGLRRERLC